MKNIFGTLVMGAACLAAATSCSVEPEFLLAGGAGNIL